jgi:hypothetical protein
MRSAAPPSINAVAATAKYHSPPLARGGPVIRAIGLAPASLRRTQAIHAVLLLESTASEPF